MIGGVINTERQKALRKKLAILMADGRWRTAGDVAARLECRPQSATWALNKLCEMGLLERDDLDLGRDKSVQYRRAS